MHPPPQHEPIIPYARPNASQWNIGRIGYPTGTWFSLEYGLKGPHYGEFMS